jgi:hypothetical protein
MALKLTPDVLAAAYEYLRATLPFSRWGLPHGEDAARVRFRVTSAKVYQGQHQLCVNSIDGQLCHDVRISSRWVKDTNGLLETMAHEMVHMRLDRIRRAGRAHHGPRFQKTADLVCRRHGFRRDVF